MLWNQRPEESGFGEANGRGAAGEKSITGSQQRDNLADWNIDSQSLQGRQYECSSCGKKLTVGNLNDDTLMACGSRVGMHPMVQMRRGRERFQAKQQHQHQARDEAFPSRQSELVEM